MVRAIPRLAAGLGWLALTAAAGVAATIERVETDGNRPAIVFVEGELEPGDEAVFRRTVQGLDRAIVALNSPGGRLGPGLTIGETVRLRGFATFVPRGAVCTSACALVWLGGIVRLVHEEGIVGFHAAWREENGVRSESGSGNALVGAYLADLGYSREVILLVTRAPPDDVVVLTPERAARAGLVLDWVGADDGGSGGGPDAAGRGRAPRQDAPPRQPEARAVAFVKRHMRRLAEPDPLPAAVVDTAYAPRVRYFGEWIDRRTLKRRIAAYGRRWPVHRIVMTGEPVARCEEGTGRCVVTGRARFEARSKARNSVSDGLMSYSYTLARPAARLVIVEESSTVIERELRPIRAEEARLTRQIQAELTRLGCRPGPIDGIWGPRTRAALERFDRAYESPRSTTRKPTAADLRRLRSVPGIICRN